MNDNDELCRDQHGFICGKSTLTNLLSFDARIVNYQLSEHPFDVVTFDFKKAFENVPHDKALQEFAVRCISGRELQWFASFLSERTHQIRLGDSFSCVASVSSGVVEGSVFGPDLYSIVAYSLMRRMRLPRVA